MAQPIKPKSKAGCEWGRTCSQHLNIHNSQKDEGNPNVCQWENGVTNWVYSYNRMPPSSIERMNTQYTTQNWGERPNWESTCSMIPSIWRSRTGKKKFYSDRNQKAFALDGGHERTRMADMFYMLTAVWLCEYTWHWCVPPHVNFTSIKKEVWRCLPDAAG